MKPWMVIVVDKTMKPCPVFRRRDAQTGIMYVNRDQPELNWNGEGLQRDRQVTGFDDEGTADQFIDWYSKEYPGSVLIKAKSVTATYRDFGPIKSGVFNEKGVIPA